jgi:hypothetical protein
MVDECDVICPKLVEYGSMLGGLNWELCFSEIAIWLIKWVSLIEFPRTTIS